MLEPGFISLPGGDQVYGWEAAYVGASIFKALQKEKSWKWVVGDIALAYKSRDDAVAAMNSLGVPSN